MGSASVESRVYSHSAGPLKVGKKPNPLSSYIFVAWLWPCVSGCSAAHHPQQHQSLSETRALTSEAFVVLMRSAAARLHWGAAGWALLSSSTRSVISAPHNLDGNLILNLHLIPEGFCCAASKASSLTKMSVSY